MNEPGARRTHIVMIPGFGGFDALGQLEYYSGVTPLFRAWQRSRGASNLVLHYFDNFPTACVATRAAQLRGYLAKRVARREFRQGDSLALVGHSTGGLDIRRLLWDLTSPFHEATTVDGDRGTAFAVPSREMLAMIRAIVFLSVPQWGTNIADWVRAHAVERAAIIAELRLAVEAGRWPIIAAIPALVAAGAVASTETNLSLAFQDALREIDPDAVVHDPLAAAEARDAASQLQLWLGHAAADFSAIDDLTARCAEDEPVSPAHFTASMRRNEVALWNRFGIRTRSFATIGTRPFRFEPGQPAPRWDLLVPCTYGEEAAGDGEEHRLDMAYRYAYRACAGGPFSIPPDTLVETAARKHAVERWDNDGIVNTASMFWPDGERTTVVRADHMDIVGHYELVEALAGSARRYHTYDLLGSACGFSATDFEQVWNEVFEFCAATCPAGS